MMSGGQKMEEINSCGNHGTKYEVQRRKENSKKEILGESGVSSHYEPDSIILISFVSYLAHFPIGNLSVISFLFKQQPGFLLP